MRAVSHLAARKRKVFRMRVATIDIVLCAESPKDASARLVPVEYGKGGWCSFASACAFGVDEIDAAHNLATKLRALAAELAPVAS